MINNAMYGPQQMGYYGGYPRNYGYVGVSTPTPIKTQLRQILTKEEIELLKKKKPAVTFDLTNEDYLAAICTHIDISTGQYTLADNEDGSLTCSICGETFFFIDPNSNEILSPEEFKVVLDRFKDIIQTMKLYIPNMSDEQARTIFPSIFATIKAIPKVYEQGAEILLAIKNQVDNNSKLPHTTQNIMNLYYELMRNKVNPSQAMYMYNNGLGQFVAGNDGTMAFQQTPQPEYFDQYGRRINAYGQPMVDIHGNPIYANQPIQQQPQQVQSVPVQQSGPVAMNPNMGPVPVQQPVAAGFQTQGPVIDYNAPVVSGVGNFPGGNAVGVVTPDQSVAGRPVSPPTPPPIQQQQDKPTVSKGFKG